ncbi:TonB-dependent receptor [Pedobacter sp. L105]|uniref:TonB-dependent receptor n=1 Tax=Pedobacter sp. L105 TaxID=1641871 RepID=UPI00131D8958|nr:TonB-dependent receptor [Pedobacter sp. L105]
MKKISTLILVIAACSGYAQVRQDTTKKLNEVVIRPYFSSLPLLRSTGSVGILNQAILDLQPNSSLVSSMNTIPGVRMEERSPGSYRLSLRGSLLRSPFGVRDVKVYFDDLPITDASGDTYLNELDISSVGNVEVLKGPQSSIYGANSGGVVLINTPELAPDSTRLGADISGGSFGLFRENVVLGKRWKDYQFNFTESYQRSDGYRDHSAMSRKYIQLDQQWDYNPAASLKALVFYSDLFYQTPGGLTAAQYALDPSLSRPASATGAIPSAITQQAAIYTKTVFGGLTNTWQISPNFKHVLSVFTSYTDFKNPFITNYEHRMEFTLGLRSYVEYEKKADDVNWKFNLGVESGTTSTDDINTDNNKGVPGAPQSSDKLKAATNFGFANVNVDLFNKLLLEISASGNLYKYHYKSSYPVVIAEQTRSFDTQFMPRAALSYLFTPDLSVRASVSRGYSPPTLAEIRATDNVINVNLQPETGWNYETGLRFKTADSRVFIDLTGFYFNQKNTIVSRMNPDETQYFVNAGATKQWGLETSLSAWIIRQNHAQFIRGLLLTNAYTLSHFKFDDYFSNGVNLSGNDLTGVPKAIVVTGLEFQLPKGFYVFAQHNYTSKLPLTDANTVYAPKYHLVSGKVGCRSIKLGKVPVEIYAGVDNLLNQKYSLGNDLNAVGGRYFNAAATRNYYAGLSLHL